MSSLARTFGRARYTLAQGARVAWYMSHYMLARRLSGPFNPPGEPKFTPRAESGSPERVRAAYLTLFAKDRANIEAGLYPAPSDFGPAQAIDAVRSSARFFADLPRVDKRRMQRRADEVRQTNEPPGGVGGRYPAYYLQNFHYQTGGWLTEESAALYDTQVEVLFGGAADAMRRLTLGSLARALKGRDQRRVRLIDIACGNGRFLTQVLGAFPRMPVVGIDLSPAYAEKAREALLPWPHADVVVAQAEHAPFDDAHFDAATSIFLFHELPPAVRIEVAREIARIVKPGGVLVFADSLQAGDTPDLDQMLEYFPVGFHEPYYASYLSTDFVALFAEAGFTHEETEHAFLTKILRFRRN